MTSALVAFIVFDLVVVTLVLVFRKQFATAAGVNFDRLREFTEFTEGAVVTHLQSRWNGELSALPAVLEGLISTLEADARTKGLPIERAWIKQGVSRWIQSKKLVDAHALREAMAKVA